jgi:hypothetical protein
VKWCSTSRRRDHNHPDRHRHQPKYDYERNRHVHFAESGCRTLSIQSGLAGFRTFVQTGIVLQVNSNPVINVILEVGQKTEEVEVQANAALVETRSTAVGQVIENEKILELPLNGRQVTDLITLSGASVQTGVADRGTFQTGVLISIAGGRSFGVMYSLDGPCTITCGMAHKCRCRSRMRFRSSRSKPAVWAPQVGHEDQLARLTQLRNPARTSSTATCLSSSAITDSTLETFLLCNATR